MRPRLTIMYLSYIHTCILGPHLTVLELFYWSNLSIDIFCYTLDHSDFEAAPSCLGIILSVKIFHRYSLQYNRPLGLWRLTLLFWNYPTSQNLPTDILQYIRPLGLWGSALLFWNYSTGQTLPLIYIYFATLDHSDFHTHMYEHIFCNILDHSDFEAAPYCFVILPLVKTFYSKIVLWRTNIPAVT